MRPLAALPKAHLHLHLEGAMRPATLVDLGASAGVVVPAPMGPESADATFAAACAVLTDLDALRRLIDEVVADAAASGAVWVEPSLHLGRHVDRLGPEPAVLEAVLDALACAGSRHRVGTGLVVAALRSQDPGRVLAQAQLASRYEADGVVAFGLDPEPGGRPLGAFVDAFAAAADGGLLCTPHAGQADGPEAISVALASLGADRIQHGLRCVEDPDLVVRLADGGASLDVSPTADVGRGRFPSLADHPLVDLVRAGVRCTLNAPDPLLFGTGVLDEFEAGRHRLDLDDGVLATLARTSIDASGAPDALKARADEAIDAWLATDVDIAVA